MARLTAYLVRLFFFQALVFAAVASALIYLIQCLRIFDVVAVKGQGVFTLLGHALLTLPPVIVGFLYVCAGVGMARGLRELQLTHELHAIHVSRRLPSLLRAVLIYAGGTATLVLLLSNFIDPASTRTLNEWSRNIAADLVSRSLAPNRFSEVVPGVTIVIGGRGANGEIVDFFADDRRDPDMRRTYMADSATIGLAEEGYVVTLRNGALQNASENLDYSQVDFQRYDIALDRLIAPLDAETTTVNERNSYELVGTALNTGKWAGGGPEIVAQRVAEGLRAFAMVLLVAAIAMFPSGSRQRWRLPLEVGILLVAFLERGISTYAPLPGTVQPFAGSVVVVVAALLILARRLELFRRLPSWPPRPALREATA